MNDQDYSPYRQKLINKQELARLSHRQFRKVVIDTLALWAQIVIAWFLAAKIDSLPFTVACACFVGNRYYSLYIIGHDGLHRRLHPKENVNDLWNDLFLIGPLGAITRINRTNHMNHHRSLNIENDPDLYKYSPRKGQSTIYFWYTLTGLPFVWKAVKNVYSNTNRKTNLAIRHKPRDLFIIVMIQLTLILALSATFGWWGFLGMWLIPVYVFTFCADITRVFCEHSTESGHVDSALAERLITYKSNLVERVIFAPMNMDHHIAHHLWPSIPYYNLPEATAIMLSRQQSTANTPITFRSSFSNYIFRYKRMNRPEKTANLP
jgi:fatty acid desaturase